MSSFVLVVPAVLQAMAMAADELIWHRRRGLPRWERIGHPIDTLSAAACYGWLCAVPPDRASALAVYVALAAFSCLLVTKDEPVHAKLCGAGEGWVHAFLFVLHPIVFLAFGVLWMSGAHPWLVRLELAATLAFAAYQ